MAQRKAKGNVEELLEGLDLEPSQEEVDLNDFLQEVSAGTSSIQILRMNRDGSRPYLDRITMDVLRENPFEMLRSQYGAGKYLLQFRGESGKIMKTKVVEVAELVPLNRQPTAPVSGNDQHLVFMREQMAMQQNLLTALITSLKPAAPVDMGSMMTGMAAMMTAISANTPKSDPALMMKTMVDAFAAMKPTVKEDPIEFTAKIIDIAKAMNGDSDRPPDSLWGVVRDVGKEVVRRIGPGGTAMQEAATVEVQPQAGAPVQETRTQLAPVPVAEVQVEETSEVQLAKWIKVALGYLKTKAKLNKNVELIVEFIFENQEEPQWNAILYAIDQGATFENLLQFDPEIAQNPAIQNWFKALYDGIHANLTQPVDSSGASGNPNDPEQDGGVSEGRPVPPVDPPVS